MYVKITESYTFTPGGRYISEGDFSGEDFRDNFLIPKLNECINLNTPLILDFDGSYGYPPGFLEETFGGLIRLGFTKDEILNTIEFISNEEPYLIDQIISYITDAHILKLKNKNE